MTGAEIRRLRCACGWEATGTEAELVVAAQDHGQRVHNMTPSRDEVMDMVLPIVPGGQAPSSSAGPSASSGPPSARRG